MCEVVTPSSSCLICSTVLCTLHVVSSTKTMSALISSAANPAPYVRRAGCLLHRRGAPPHHLHVTAGRERRSAASEDDRPQLSFCSQILEHLVELDANGGAQRIQPLGLIQPDDGSVRVPSLN